MSSHSAALPGDQARVSVAVAVPPDVAFRIFTEEIDLWWRRGLKYRAAGARPGSIHMEPRLGGRLWESFESDFGMQSFEIGKITIWEPPSRLVFDWRAVNFSTDENTEVEVTFERNSNGTLVSVTHRGWSGIRSDHPVRHHLDTSAFIRTMGLWWGDLMRALLDYSGGRGVHPTSGI